MASSTTHVRGLQASLKELRKIDPKLATAARKRLRDDAKPIIQEAKSMIPDVPLSRWHAGTAKMQDRKGQKTLRTGSGFPVFESAGARRRIALSITNKGVKGYTGKRRLIAVVEKDASGQILDYAGRKNSSNQFARNLSKKNGKASRFMWPAAEKHKDAVRASIRKSVREIERDVNMRLRMRSI
ncbi:MAG: hypothetical protein WCG15_00545 [Actinomycetes bacterium]